MQHEGAEQQQRPGLEPGPGPQQQQQRGQQGRDLLQEPGEPGRVAATLGLSRRVAAVQRARAALPPKQSGAPQEERPAQVENR